MKHFSCVIVDDEPKVVEHLQNILETIYEGANIIATFTTWRTALNFLRDNSFDILFLDISMPEKGGFEILKLLPKVRCEIIFVTAHEEYALPALKLFASGYILKPVDEGELSDTVNKALERINKDSTQHKPEHGLANKLGIPASNGIDYVNIDDIIYLETINKCTKVVTITGDHVSSYNLGKFKELLEAYSFYQVHRSYIINLNFVKRYNSEKTVLLTDGHSVPISRSFRNDFLHLFNRVS